MIVVLLNKKNYMSLPGIKDYLMEKLEENNFHQINGTDISVKLPVHISLINSVLSELLNSSEKMQDFKILEFKEADNDEFTIELDHKRLKRTVRCRINSIDYGMNGDPHLPIVFLEGIRFYERAILDSLFSVKKGLKWFSMKLKGEKEVSDRKQNAFKISGSGLVINLAEVFRMVEVDVLNQLIKWEGLYTYNDMVIVRLKIIA
jgi:hypothetical protein